MFATLAVNSHEFRRSGIVMFDRLFAQGFQIDFRSHARAILGVDFPAVAAELEEVLLASTIPIEEIIGSGGGETKGTQRLRNALKRCGWNKHVFVVQRIIDGIEREAQSHEVDHVRTFDGGTVALEIEWNNKDPFFDRDLENFKRLHADGAISLGIIITRGSGLQDSLRGLVKRFADEAKIDSHDDIQRIGLNPTRRQIADVRKRVERTKNPVPFRDAWVEQFVSDKFGAATTHWSKLEDRVHRGVGNPCPLVLIGLPSSTVTFGEDLKAVEQLLTEGGNELRRGPDDPALVGRAFETDTKAAEHSAPISGKRRRRGRRGGRRNRSERAATYTEAQSSATIATVTPASAPPSPSPAPGR